MTKTTKKSSRMRSENPANPTRDAILASLKAHPSLRQHPAEKTERLYISGFLTSNGRTFAVGKHAASLQPIWVRRPEFPAHALPNIKRKFYPPEKGRSSNLHIFGGDFKNGNLVCLFPQTCADALKIVDHLLAC